MSNQKIFILKKLSKVGENMARPSKSAKVLHDKSQTKAEIAKRIETEDRLRGASEKIKPSARLNANQKKVFNYIVAELEASNILGNLDTFILETASIAIDRLQGIEKIINQDFDRICDKDLMQAKSKYTTDFFKCCQQLSLSPESRAKMGIMSLNQAMEEVDPLLKVLSGGK
jgi:P27 family predicted phage terminase small subunit